MSDSGSRKRYLLDATSPVPKRTLRWRKQIEPSVEEDPSDSDSMDNSELLAHVESGETDFLNEGQNIDGNRNASRNRKRYLWDATSPIPERTLRWRKQIMPSVEENPSDSELHVLIKSREMDFLNEGTNIDGGERNAIRKRYLWDGTSPIPERTLRWRKQIMSRSITYEGPSDLDSMDHSEMQVSVEREMDDIQVINTVEKDQSGTDSIDGSELGVDVESWEMDVLNEGPCDDGVLNNSENTESESGDNDDDDDLESESGDNDDDDRGSSEDHLSESDEVPDESDHADTDTADTETDTDSEEMDEIDDDNPDLDLPLSAQSQVSVGQAITLILAFVMRHTSTKVALKDLLLLIRALHGPCRLPRSLYYFDKYFRTSKGVVELNFYCDLCKKNLGNDPSDTCGDCAKTKSKMARRSDGDFFIHIPIKKQIKQLLERPEIHGALNYRFERTKKAEGNIEDVYDGRLYKECEGLMDNPYNISLLWNTDGISCSKSSNFSIWPIQFVINELPPKLRRKNILLGGIWFGKDKPERDLYYDAFVQECNELQDHGVKWRNSRGDICKSNVFALMCTCDSPARSMIMNQKQFNGFYGCSWCLHPGRRVAQGGGTAHVYEYENEPSDLRTKRETLKDVKKAPSNGVKGPSVIMKLKAMDPIKGQSVDYLHADLAGVTESTLDLWLDPPDKTLPYYIGRSLKQIDARLMPIKPPNVLPSVPRSLTTRKKWKAKEFMFWLIYYSLPCVIGVLPPVYFKHWLLLVSALSIYLGTSISEADFTKAAQMLVTFVQNYGRLYGVNHMTFNVHSLLHVPECVKNMGPLWTCSTFLFEGNNKSLTNLAHGTQNVPLQIGRRFVLRLKCSPLHTRFIQGTELALLHRQIVYNNLSLNSLLLEDGIRGHGKPVVRNPTMEEAHALEIVLTNIVPEKVAFFKRATVNGVMLHSKNYRKVRKRNSYCIKFKNGSFGIVVWYCYIRKKAYALYNEVILSGQKIGHDQATGASASHIHVIRDVAEMRATELVGFSEICLLISSSKHDKRYLIELPNTVELD